jgi:hypothetical protein
MNAKEAATVLGVSGSQVSRLCVTGVLKAHKTIPPKQYYSSRAQWVIYRDDLDAYIAERNES